MILKNFPIPPSINNQLTLSRGRFIKTSAAKIYDAKVSMFKLRRFREIDLIKENLKSDDLLKVDCYFIFNQSRLIGKKGQIKALDVNNYLKSALDGLVKCLEIIDDKQFVAHTVEKLTCESESDEQIIFVISKTSLRSYKKAEPLEFLKS